MEIETKPKPIPNHNGRVGFWNFLWKKVSRGKKKKINSVYNQIRAWQIKQITKKMIKYIWFALWLLKSDMKWNY